MKADYLVAEIVEIKNKPTIPTGTIGMDAFGQKPHFEDKGIRKRTGYGWYFIKISKSINVF